MGKKNRPNWGKAPRSSKKTLENVALNFIKYMELAKAARGYLKATNRFKPKVDFMLQVEADFCLTSLESLFRVSKAFVIDGQKLVLADVEQFKEEVKRFSDGCIPERPLIVTGNLEQEMTKIIGNKEAFGKGVKPK